MKLKILVIDDEESWCEILKYNLEKEGYEVNCAYSAEEALEMDLTVYSLFVVDVMMTELSGFDFAKHLRSNVATESKPIIFCTALVDEDSTVEGLNIGGDDYITKPFVLSEVKARVRAVLRRSQQQSNVATVNPEATNSNISFESLNIDYDQKLGYLNDTDLELTKTEFDILLFFLTNRNRIFSREEIIQQVWGQNTIITTRTIDTNIARLRKKIGPYGNNIVTRPGFGYGFKETT